MLENETFIEQEEKFLKGLLEKYHSENPKEEINLEESDIEIYANTSCKCWFGDYLPRIEFNDWL